MTEQNLVSLEQSPAIASVDGRYVSMLSCLVLIARQQGLFLSEHQLALDNQLSEDRVAPQELVFIAQRAGLKGRAVRLRSEDLFSLHKSCPAIVLLKSGGAMVLNRVTKREGGLVCVELLDPKAEPGAAVMLDVSRFEQGWTGEIVLVRRVYQIADEEQPFSLSYIAGLVFRERRIIRDISLSAILLSFLQLMPFLYYRLMMGDVVPFYAMNTFISVTIGLAWVLVFLTIFTYLRGYLLQIVTTRVDARMNEYVFDRVLNLPIDFFERTQVGEIAHDVFETEKIRTFLVNQLFGTLLDATVLFFFLPVMIYISPMLSAVVIGIMAIIMIVIIVSLPGLRAASGRVQGARVKRGSFLYQTLAGMRTVKSLALESRQRSNWDSLTAEVARREYELGHKANALRTMVYPLEQLATTGSYAVGVFSVLYTRNPALEGSLIIFLMLVQRTAAPLIQMSRLVEQYDEARIAVERVKALVNRPLEENAGDHGVRKPLLGHVSFSGLRFQISRRSELRAR